MVEVNRRKTGALSGALFLLGLTVFILATTGPLFGPIATFCVAMGALGALALWAVRRPRPTVSILDDSRAQNDRKGTRPK